MNFSLGTIFALFKAVDELTGPAAAMARAVDQSTDKMGSSFDGLHVRIQRVNTLAKEFGGGAVIQKAEEYAGAVAKIGGAAKLTESEQAKVNRVVTEAIQKYQALGMTAPKAMLDLQEATKKVVPPTEDMGNSLGSMATKAKNLAGMLGIAFTGAAVVSGIKTLVGNTLEYASAVNNVSQKLDVSTAATQRWKFAAEQGGGTLDQVATSVINLSKGLAGGDKGMKEAIDLAGLSFDAIRAMKPEDAFNAVVAAVEKIPDPMTQTRVATELLGKSGAELLPAIRAGFIRTGEGATLMSDTTIKSLAAAQDKWAEMENKITVATGGIVAKILGMMEKVAPAMQLLFALSGKPLEADMWGVWAKGADKAAASIHELTAAQKREVDQLLKNGIPAHQIYDKSLGQNEASVLAYIASLQKAAPANDKYTAQLAKVRAELAALSPAVIANFKAAEQLGKSNEDLAKVLGLTEGHVAILKNQLRAAETQTKASASEGKKFADDLKSLADRYANLVKQGVPAAEIVERLGKDALTSRDRAQELGKGLSVIPPALNNIAKQYIINTALEKANQEAAKMTPVIVAANVKATAEWVAARNKAEAEILAKARATVTEVMSLHLTEAETKIRQAEQWRDKSLAAIEVLKVEEPGIYRYVTEQIASEYRRRVDLAKASAEQEVSALAKAFAGLPAIIIGALQGGGDVVKSVASHLGAALFGPGSGLNGLLNKGLSGLATKLGGGFAASLAHGISAALPGIGALIGPGLVSLGSKLLGFLGIGKNAGRDAAIKFAEGLGGFDALREKLLVLGDEGERLWIRLTQTARGAREVSAATEAIRDALSRFEKEQERVKGLREEMSKLAAEGGLASKALMEFMRTNSSDADVLAFKWGQVQKAGSEVGKMLEALERSAKAAGKEFTLTANGAKAMAGILLASWDGSAEGLRKMAPDIERLRAAMERSGIDGGKAFSHMSAMAQLASSEVSGPLLEAINAGTAALTAMYNSGFLTQDVFSGMVGEVMAQRDALLATGASAAVVNGAMQKDLQRIWELTKDGGYAVDEKTAALLREAEAAGTVGDKFRSSEDRMVRALERIANLFEDVFGNKLMNSAERGAEGAINALNKIPKDIDITVRTSVRSDSWPTQNVPGGADWGGAMAAGGSGVVSRPTWFLAGEAGPERFSFTPVGRGSTSGGLTINVNHAVVREEQDIKTLTLEIAREINLQGWGR